MNEKTERDYPKWLTELADQEKGAGVSAAKLLLETANLTKADRLKVLEVLGGGKELKQYLFVQKAKMVHDFCQQLDELGVYESVRQLEENNPVKSRGPRKGAKPKEEVRATERRKTIE